jgi:hypothetical protein
LEISKIPVPFNQGKRTKFLRQRIVGRVISTGSYKANLCRTGRQPAVETLKKVWGTFQPLVEVSKKVWGAFQPSVEVFKKLWGTFQPAVETFKKVWGPFQPPVETSKTICATFHLYILCVCPDIFMRLPIMFCQAKV